MSKIVSKNFSWDDANIASQGVVSFNVYYVKGGAVDYASPKVSVAVVAGQATYTLAVPAQLPLTEGQYQLGVSALDAAGNESDIAVLNSPFDFTAPTAPVNLKVS